MLPKSDMIRTTLANMIACSRNEQMIPVNASQGIINFTGPVQSHFFGHDTFQRLWANWNADIVVTFALDEHDNPPLPPAPAAPANSSGKVSAQSSFENASATCPPVCSM